GEVRAFMEHAFFNGAVPGESDRDVVAPLLPERQRGAHADGNGTADDRDAEKKTGVMVEQMHRATAAPAGARGLAIHLGHHAPEISAFRQVMGMGTVI